MNKDNNYFSNNNDEIVSLYNQYFKRNNLSWRIFMKDILYSNDLVVDELINHNRDKEDEIECEGCLLKVNLKYLQVLLYILYFITCV